MSYVKLVSYDIHIGVLISQSYIIDVVRSNYINSLEIMCCFDAKNI
jgi:hypothetical protein